MRSVFVGSVHSSRAALDTMVEMGFPPDLVVTLPYEFAHRHSDYADLRPLANSSGVRVLEAGQVNSANVLSELRHIAPDLIFVIGWSQICGPEFLSIPAAGAIGYHPAALPENRGRAVIPWTILQEQTETGSTLFWLDAGMDSGDILIQRRFRLAPAETAESLYSRHLDSLRSMLGEILPALARGEYRRSPQDHSLATYCAKRTPDDGLIDWTDGARQIWTLIRAVGAPYPGAFTYYEGKRIEILRAAYVGSAPFWGLPGQIQKIMGDGTALVQCGDGEHISVEEIREPGGSVVSPGKMWGNHRKLGMDVPALMRRLDKKGHS